MFIYNIKTSTWKKVKQSLVMPVARRNHITIQIGRYLLICGGINTKGLYLDDVWTFDLFTNEWELRKTINNPYSKCGIAYHAACLVLQP